MQTLESLYLTRVCPSFSFLYRAVFYTWSSAFMLFRWNITRELHFTYIKIIELQMSKPAAMATQEARPLREHFCGVYTKWVILFWALPLRRLGLSESISVGFAYSEWCYSGSSSSQCWSSQDSLEKCSVPRHYRTTASNT